jgi:hypothetical protein
VAAVFLGVFDAVLLVLMAGVPLTVLKLGSRIPQTLLALASAGFVVSIVDVFLLFLLSDLPLPEDLLGRVITFLTFPIFLWKVLINTTLLRYALSWNFACVDGCFLGRGYSFWFRRVRQLAGREK